MLETHRSATKLRMVLSQSSRTQYCGKCLSDDGSTDAATSMISCSRSQQQNTRLAQDWPGDAPTVFEPSQKALREQKFTFDMLDHLHLQRSEKGTPPGQQGEYTGVIVDTHLLQYPCGNSSALQPTMNSGTQRGGDWKRCSE